MDDEAAIRTLIQDRTTAMRTGDAATLCGSYTPDVVVFSLAPPLVQPPNGTRNIAQMQAWFAEKGGSVWSEVRDLQVTVDGSLALCTSLDSMGAPPGRPAAVHPVVPVHPRPATGPPRVADLPRTHLDTVPHGRLTTRRHRPTTLTP